MEDAVGGWDGLWGGKDVRVVQGIHGLCIDDWPYARVAFISGVVVCCVPCALVVATKEPV